MRNLTVKRTKSFVGCLMKVKVYIEDQASGEITINGTPCRKIGDLKNGEEKTFQIDESAAKVFVIADQVSKDYCNDSYQLPEGQDDVFLSGKCKLNPATANAFRFDNNDNEATRANRKRGARIGLVVLIVAIIFGVLIGIAFGKGLLSLSSPQDKTFIVWQLNITLTRDFKATEVEELKGQDPYAYESDYAGVIVIRDRDSLFNNFNSMTTDDYANTIMQINDSYEYTKSTEDGLTKLEYDYTDNRTKTAYHYSIYLYKSKDAFWMVEFSTLKSDADKYAKSISKWAKSVRFSE